MKNITTKRLVHAALMTAIVIALTLIVVPVPVTNGYINLGDAGVYACVAAVTGGWGVIAAAVGSMLADVVLGYTIYAPATFIIKGAAAFFAMLVLKRFKGGWRVPGLIACGLFIAGGYLLFETVFVCESFAAALVNLPFNCLQGVVGGVLGYAAVSFIEKAKLSV